MAVSLGVFSSFAAVETASPTKSSSSSTSSRFGVRSVPFASRVNLRTARTVTSAAASKPATEAAGKGEPKGIMKPRRVSPEMQAFLGGVPEIARTQALKEIWAYIKEHNLQVPLSLSLSICIMHRKVRTLLM